jgi:type III secretory pathway component EscT
MNEVPIELRLLVEKFAGDIISPEVRLLPMALLMMARIIPFIYMCFFLGSRLVPMPVKVFMSISLFIYMVPEMLNSATRLDFGWNYLGYLFKEMFVGIILGMLAAIPNYIVMASGMTIDFQRGASSLVSTNPILSVQDSPVGILFGYLLIYLYWLQEIPFIYIEAMATSYKVFPIDKFIPASVFTFDGYLYTELRDLFTQMYALGIQLAAPSLVIILMIDMFLGITNRLAPQVMISFLAQGLKAMLGLTVLFLGWYFIMDVFAKEALVWAQHFTEWVLKMPF